MITRYTRKKRFLRFWTYDFEWIPETYELTLAGLYDGCEYSAYRNIDEFLSAALTRRNRGAVFFAHNGGAADIQFILSRMIGSRYVVEGHWSQSSLIICRVSDGRNRWTFADSCWLIRSSLQTIAEGLGTSKAARDYRCSNWPGCGHSRGCCIFYASWNTLREYNRLDCTILYDAIEELEKIVVELGGQLELTIASTAMKLFRSAFLRRNIGTCSVLNRTIASSYVGSRVEVFSPDCGSAGIYDVNSSFPFSMLRDQPGELLRVDKTFKESKPLAVVDATVSVPAMYIPPVPLRVLGKVFFPVGTFRRWFTGEDLLLCLETGGDIETVHESYHFSPCGDMREYVERIYALRQRASGFRAKVLKILLNSLYGKTGEGPYGESLLINPSKRPICSRDPMLGCTADVCRCTHMYRPGVYKITRYRNVPHAHVPMAATITSMSRSLLTRELLRLRGAGKDVYYCDTDSVVTTGSPCSLGTGIGDWKLEKSLRRGVFLSPKLYAYETVDGLEHVRAKGFSSLTFDEFMSLRRGEAIEQTRMARIKELYGAGLFSPRDKIVVKRSRACADSFGNAPKRRPLENGETVPWDASELV